MTIIIILPEQIFRSMIHMVVGEGRHGEVAMIVPVLPADIYSPLAPCRFFEILGQELSLLVEVVGYSLCIDPRQHHTHR